MIKEKKIPSGYKASIFGPIPNEWKVEPLGNYGEVISGLTYSPDDVKENGVLVLRSSNVQNRMLEFNDNVFVEINEGDYTPVKEGDILICVRNGSKSLIGKNALITKNAEGMAFGAFMSIFRSKINNYLYHLFNTDYYNREIHINLGATINSINGSDLKKFKFPFPPPYEQTAIANLLSTWDKAIQATSTLIEQKQNRKKWLMQMLLTGKKRLKGFEKEKWKEVRLGDITRNFSHRNKDIEDARVYSVTNSNGFVLQSEHFSREIAGDDLSNYKIIKKHEFAYNPARINVGSIAYFEKEIGIISSLYVCFATTKDVEDFFLQEVLKLDHTKHKIGAYGEGGVRIYLWYDLFKKIKIELPSVENQKAVCKVLKSADLEIELLKKKRDQLKEQKKGLMQTLLTGKKRLKVN